MSEHSNGHGGVIPEARHASNGSTPWGRQSGASEERVTSRQRRMAEGLPAWEPLPPGEVLIRRPSQS
jgi:hypothetical protein